MPDSLQRNTDPSQNFISRQSAPLDAIFKPKSVALIGAKDDIGSVGRTLLTNLIEGKFGGSIFPINPKRKEVLGLKCFPSLSHIPEPVDLAVIVTPAITVPGIIAECVEEKTRAAIIISAGFKELGPSGLKLEQEIVTYARSANMPIIGPNCLGVMNPIYGLNATFARGMALKGNIAFLSQSGAMCTSVLDWSFKEQIGFSAFVSVGSMADVGWGDLIDYLGDDPETHSILMYMETIGEARSFLSAAREIALEKPIIVIKAGKSAAAAQAAASHTGSLAGSDEVFDAALERVGVLRVNSIAELFQIASALSRQPRPKGPRLSIVSNAGGPAVLAVDRLVQSGGELAPVSGKTLKALNEDLPEAWSHSNPIDILGDATPERYANTLKTLAQDESNDGLLVILSPQDMTDPMMTAEVIKSFAHIPNKPLLASWMGGSSVLKGIEILSKAQVPTFEYPDDAAAAFATMWRYSKNLQTLYQTPSVRSEGQECSLSEAEKMARKEAEEIILQARNEGRELLDEYESKRVLAGFDIPIVETLIATSEDEAMVLAEKLGFPVVLKLYSKVITHKSDVGGVKLNLKSRSEVRTAFNEIRKAVENKVIEAFRGVTVQKMIAYEGYELILGSSFDEQFGPVLLFGTGGQLVEIFKDKALSLPPLNYSLARLLMQKTKIFQALKGVRGKKSVNLAGLESVLVKFSEMVVANTWIKECDINPLLVSPAGIIALDARIVLFPKEIKEPPKLAIRPYPSHYIEKWKLKSGIPLVIRPIMPEDEPNVVAFHKELSENTVRQRFFEFLSLDERIAHERLIRICFNDYDRELALVAEINDAGKKRIIGIARLSRILHSKNALFTMIISDPFHRQGLGSEMLKQIIRIAKNEKVEKIIAYILAENEEMMHLCKKQGFNMEKKGDTNIIKAEIKLIGLQENSAEVTESVIVQND